MWPGGEIYVAEWCPLVTILVFSSSAHFSFSYLCNKKHVDGLSVQPTPCSSDPRDCLALPPGELVEGECQQHRICILGTPGRVINVFREHQKKQLRTHTM